MESFSDSGILIRAAFFGLLLALIIAAEFRSPRRALHLPRSRRWPSNLGLGALNILLLRLVFPFLGVSLAMQVEEVHWGLFHLLNLPGWLNFIASVLLLDLLIWAQHRLFHRSNLLWRLHRMHHADPDFDTTTAVRFHTFEAVLSMVIKSAAILALGVDPLAFLTFEVLLSSTSLFNHANLKIPAQLDHYLRWILVTPDMHRVHHSRLPDELNSNFGFNLPWWDRMFGTYRDQPALGHGEMEIGLDVFADVKDQQIDKLLLQPFR